MAQRQGRQCLRQGLAGKDCQRDCRQTGLLAVQYRPCSAQERLLKHCLDGTGVETPKNNITVVMASLKTFLVDCCLLTVTVIKVHIVLGATCSELLID
jgi:hypothetical protein